MWIAKNSVTGKEYGKHYESIYDCQSFIDGHLKLLEYEMQRCFSLEEEFLDEIAFEKKTKTGSFLELFSLRIQKATDTFMDNSDFSNKCKIIIEQSLKKGSTKRDIDEKLENYARTNWLKNNIIRCYETNQKRWADGFDF